MKISTNHWLLDKTYEPCTLDECADILTAAGFDAVDFPVCDWPDQDNVYATDDFAQTVLDSAAKLKSHGLTINQTHLPFRPGHYPALGNGSFDDFAEIYIPMEKRMLELSAELGARIAVIHLYSGKTLEDTYESNMRYIDALRPFAESTGVRIAIENLFGWNQREGIITCGVSTADELCRYADYGGEMFGVCIDTGHAMLLGEDPVEMIRRCGKRVIALHINENPGSRNRDDLHMLPNTMCWSKPTKWEDVSAALKATGYSGFYNMELIVPYGTPKVAFPAFYAYAGALARYYAGLAE